MHQIVITEQAKEDLFSIWLYIADDNIGAADKLTNDIEKGWLHLCEYPFSGEARTDIAPDIRLQITRKYVTLYKSELDNIVIVRVLAPKGKPLEDVLI